VTGEPGVGKTTCVDRFLQSAGRLPAVVIARGQGAEGFGGQEAYYPLLTALEQLVRASDDRRLTQTLATSAPTWLLQFPPLVPRDQRERLQRAPLGAPPARMVRKICETLETITADRTVILVFEDLYWADLPTLDVISSYARRAGPSRLLLIGTLRSTAGVSSSALSRLHQDLVIHELCTEIALTPFDPPEVTEYLSRTFGQVEFARDLVDRLHRHSGGNPLFVSALVRDLLANGTVAREGATWRLAVDAERIEPAVPATLQDMLN